jgi:hypothetical protein
MCGKEFSNIQSLMEHIDKIHGGRGIINDIKKLQRKNNDSLS